MTEDSPTMAPAYPPPPLTGNQLVQSALPYSLLFVLGTLGNIAVLSYVFFITRSLKSSVTALGNTFVYIVALCCVDLLVTVSIPFSLSSTVLNNWVFGEFGCKVHWALELSNKMCSTFILTALAFDRYMAICHPENKRIHEMRQTICITSSLALLSFCLILPVVFSATVKTLDDWGEYTLIKKAGPVTYRVVKSMCVDGMRRDSKLLVSAFLIFFAFLLPCSALTFFYAKIILRLRRQQRTMLQSRIPIRRITTYTMAVTVFYLSCQIPYWLPQIYGVYCMLTETRINPALIKFTYYCHLFPFLSASLNWIFYARLNSQFKKGLVLVTERLIRKRTRSIQNNGWRDRDTLEEMGLELMSKTDDILTVCPHCEAQLTAKDWKIAPSNGSGGNGAMHNGSGRKISLMNGNGNGHAY